MADETAEGIKAIRDEAALFKVVRDEAEDARSNLSGILNVLKGTKGPRISVIRSEVARAQSALNTVMMLTRSFSED